MNRLVFWRRVLIYHSSRWLRWLQWLHNTDIVLLNCAENYNILKYSITRRGDRAHYSTTIKGGSSSPVTQWPGAELQIRNTQVEKKQFYACARCQGANSECNPTCNTCSSPNYCVILAGQNLPNFCNVGISSDSEAWQLQASTILF